MKKTSNRDLIVIRPRRKNHWLKKKLKNMAEESTYPSLNSYLENKLIEIAKK